MTIQVTQLPETKIWKDAYKQYVMTYPDGYPVNVRIVFCCEDCGVDVGGKLGNQIYRWPGTKLCEACGQKYDLIVRLCIAQTGMTPVEYQNRHQVAWNE